MFVCPPFVRSGDLVLIIATARARSLEAIQPAINELRSWGLEVEVGKNALKTHHQFAGTDRERAEDLQWALDHKSAKAILISGGGYGSLRIIDTINLAGFQKNPKWLIGYSDTTVLHSRLLKNGYACIHGTMAFQFHRSKEASDSVRRLLFGEGVMYTVPAHNLNRPGNCEGEVIGGNLSLLYALSGSRDDMDTAGKILFIEDLDEQLYHIDRMMLQLKRSGKLANLAGLVVGGMTDMKDNAVPFGSTAEMIIHDAVSEYKYPLCFDFPAGHIERNLALYLGKKASLVVNQNEVELRY